MSTVEVTRFRLREVSAHEQFVAADERLQQDWYYQQPGVARRMTASSPTGWMSVCWWSEETDLGMLSVRDGRHVLLSFESVVDLVDPDSITTEVYTSG